MKRFRNAALLLSCMFGASHAHATNGVSNDVRNEVSNRNANANWNWNHNANRNYNRSTNQLTNHNSNKQHQGQGQGQQQSQSVRNSGNSSSSSSGVGYGGRGGRGGQGGQGGQGGLGGQGGQGGAVSNAGNNTGNSSAALTNANNANASGNHTMVQGDTNTYAAPPRPPVSTAIAPSLVSGADTCMGSTSIGAQGVSLGLSFGKTWTDDNCVMLKNSTLLWNMGRPDAAIALLCSNEQIRKAIEQSGSECPDGRKPAPVAVVPAQPIAPMPQPDAATSPMYYEPEPTISARDRRDKG